MTYEPINTCNVLISWKFLKGVSSQTYYIISMTKAYKVAILPKKLRNFIAFCKPIWKSKPCSKCTFSFNPRVDGRIKIRNLGYIEKKSKAPCISFSINRFTFHAANFPSEVMIVHAATPTFRRLIAFHLWNFSHSIIVDPTYTVIFIASVYLNLVLYPKLSFTSKPSMLYLIISALLFKQYHPMA